MSIGALVENSLTEEVISVAKGENNKINVDL